MKRRTGRLQKWVREYSPSSCPSHAFSSSFYVSSSFHVSSSFYFSVICSSSFYYCHDGSCSTWNDTRLLSSIASFLILSRISVISRILSYIILSVISILFVISVGLADADREAMKLSAEREIDDSVRFNGYNWVSNDIN